VEGLAACKAALAEAKEWGSEQLPLLAVGYVGLGQMYYEPHDLAEAKENLLKAETLGRAGGLLEVTWLAYISLAITKQARGDGSVALRYVDLADQIAPRIPWALATAVTARMWIQLSLGQREQAYRFAPQLEALVKGQRFPMERAARCLARIKLEQGFPEEALAVLASLARDGQRSIRFQALQALAHQGSGAQERALEHLGHALSLAAPQGSVTAFLELGKPMAGLLTLALPTLRGHVRRLLDHFGSAAPAPRRPAAGLIDPPSERELEVLRLLAEGVSNEEIAQRLFISLHTAKKHVANLLGKLGAANRTQAVARSRECIHLFSPR
jgi:LuxR family maltose regulon positive regulatory protein